MKVLVTGAKGQLGSDVVKALQQHHIPVVALDRESMDITNEKHVVSHILDEEYSHIIHCAAYTAVDKAEDDRENCFLVNEAGTKHIVKGAKQVGATLIYISTDYVFSGEEEGTYSEDSPVKPINIYGESKLRGEEIVQEELEKYFILRISWVFGMGGNNFVKTMLNLAKDRQSLTVVSDQVGSPTYTKDVSKLLISILNSNEYGIYHVTNEGYTSWYNFAREIFKEIHIPMYIEPIRSEEFPTKAKRPHNSKLNKDKLHRVFGKLPAWEDSLREFLKEYLTQSTNTGKDKD